MPQWFEFLGLENVELVDVCGLQHLEFTDASRPDDAKLSAISNFQGGRMRNGNWKDIFRFVGECKLRKCYFHFANLYDEGWWEFNYQHKLRIGLEQGTTLARLLRWMRYGGEFPLDSMRTSLYDATLRYEEQV